MRIHSLKFKKHIPSHIKFSIIFALGITCVNYFVNNFPIITSLNINLFACSQKIFERFDLKKSPDNKNVVFINTSYDNQLIAAYGGSKNKKINKEIIGNTIITDRLKLYKFLNLLDKSHNYKYVLLNIRFEKDDITEYDNSLFSLIEQMDNIAYAESANDINIVRPELTRKAAPAEYSYTIATTNFTKYEYIANGKRHLPLKVFEDLNPEKKIKQYGCKILSMYFTQGKLCQNSLFLNFDSNPFSEYIHIDTKNNISKKNFYNLGSDFINLLDNSIYTESEMEEKIKLLTDGKYVVIGDMTENMHDSYIGKKPGCLILFRALQALDKKENIVSPYFNLLWSFIYFLIILYLFKGKSISTTILEKISSKKIPKRKRLRTLFFYGEIILYIVLHIASFTFVLSCCQIIEFICCKRIHSIIFPIICLTFFKIIIIIGNETKKHCNSVNLPNNRSLI